MDQRSKEEKRLAKKIRVLLIQCGHPEPYRSYAEKELRELGSEAVPEILRQLSDAKSSLRYWPIDLFVRLLAIYVLFLLLSFVVPIKSLSRFWTWSLILGVYSVWRLKGQREHATAALTYISDLRALSAISEGVTSPRRNLRALCRAAITNLLPQVTEQNSELLTPAARKSLNESLMADDPGLVVPILAAYRRVGDGSAIPHVEALAMGRAGLGKTSEEVRELAKSILPILRERAERERDSWLLLRAAESPNELPDTLMRPVFDTDQPDPQVLLRPTESP